MRGVTRRALRVYAALNELKGKDEDVLDALIPFFEPILEKMHGRIFDPHVFAVGVRKLYKWRFTDDIAANMAPRFERKGLLKKEVRSKLGSVYVVKYADQRDPQDQRLPEITAVFEQIITEFEQFPPKVTDLLSYKKTRDELKDILIRFLVMMERPGEGAYMLQLGELGPGAEAQQLIDDLEEGGSPLDSNDRYMCARFIQHIMRRKKEFVPHLTRLSSIGLLAEVVEDFLKPTHVEARIDLTVVLDAPIALDLLGCSEKSLKEDVSAVVEALRKIGASFVVLPISCEEIQHNLRSMLALPREQRRGYTHNALIKKETTEEFVRAVANNPEAALQNVGVTVRPIDLQTYPNSHKFFTPEEYDDFLASVTWGKNFNAKEHDAMCVAMVMRLRDGKQHSDVFKSKFVMVTRNSLFVQKARDYCIKARKISRMQEGPVIDAQEMATVAWLRTGLGADETIPRGYLIATCDRVLQVRPEVRTALAAELAKVTPERIDQFNLLMQDARSVQRLADQTLNNENAVTPANAELLLEAMKEATAEDLRQKHEAELALQQQSIRDTIELRDKANAELVLQLEASNQERDQLTRTNSRLADQFDLQLKVLAKDANRMAFAVEAIVIVALICLMVLAVYNWFTGSLEGKAYWIFVGAVFALIGIVRVIFALLERPMPALATVLNALCKSQVERRLKALKLDDQGSRFKYANGRTVVK